MDDTLIRILKKEASASHMCEEYRTALAGASSPEEAIALYKKCINWALENGYPTLEVLRKYFSGYQSEGVYVGQEFSGEVLTDLSVYVFHDCKGFIRTGLNVARKIIPMLYFANGCDMTIIGTGPEVGMPSIVPIHVFGDNRIDAVDSKAVVFNRRK